MSEFGSVGFGLRILISWFFSEHLDSGCRTQCWGVRVWVSGLVFLGLGLRIWIFGFGPQDLNPWVLIPGIGSLHLNVWDWVSRFRSLDLFGFVSGVGSLSLGLRI